jgi:hypothetical protein
MAAAMFVDHGNLAVCISQAARIYGADGAIVAAYVVERGGKSGEIRQLTNGEIEIGLSRIPGREAEALRANGITPQMLADNDCLNVAIATYLLQRDARRFERTVTPPAREGDCLVSAAARYSLPVDVLQAVIATEGGWDGLKKRNRNGSYDLGRAQINTVHLQELSKYGVSEQQLMSDVCVNYHVAAYRLRFEINRAGEFWRGVGNYHSRTPSLSQSYQSRVRRNLGQAQVTSR